MDYRPKRKDFKAASLCGFSATLAIVLFLMSSAVQSYKWAYQLAGLFLAIIAVQIFTINVQSDYVYKADERDIKVYRVTGKKSLCVCSLSYEESLSQVVTAKYFNEHKNEFPQNKLAVNYCKNIFPEEYYLYFFNFNGKVYKLKFEPDDIFAKHMNEKIKTALENKENEDYDNE